METGWKSSTHCQATVHSFVKERRCSRIMLNERKPSLLLEVELKPWLK